MFLYNDDSQSMSSFFPKMHFMQIHCINCICIHYHEIMNAGNICGQILPMSYPVTLEISFWLLYQTVSNVQRRLYNVTHKCDECGCV